MSVCIHVKEPFVKGKVDIFNNKYVSSFAIHPIWEDVRNAICVGSSSEYAPYLCVYLKSVIDNCHQKKDIIIFEKDISKENKDIILKYFSQYDVSIRFINPSSFFKGTNLYISHDYFKEECYYRIVAPTLLPDYDKIIFTDLDLIVCDDILKLADFDMGEYPIAACIEPIWRELYMQNNRIHNTDIRLYTKNILNLSDPFMYYNTGVVVFNVKKYNKLNSFEHILEIINSNKLLYQEQDALNIFFKGMFYTIPYEWNFELAPSLINNIYNFDFYKEYKDKEDHAKIFHYLGRNKPWKNANEYKANIWWKYAQKTPFYEKILQKLIETCINKTLETHILKIKESLSTTKHKNFKLKYIQYYIFSKITFGKLGKKCMRKKVYYRNILNNMKK